MLQAPVFCRSPFGKQLWLRVKKSPNKICFFNVTGTISYDSVIVCYNLEVSEPCYKRGSSWFLLFQEELNTTLLEVSTEADNLGLVFCWNLNRPTISTKNLL